jgi:hypothetical protein
MKTKERFLMYVKIAERAEELGIYHGTRSTLLMDIESADIQFNMRLEDWLNADDFNFAHDVVGIVHNADRGKFPAEFSRFLPRFSGK